MASLEADGLRAEARLLGNAVLKGMRRFPGRDRVVARLARLKP